MKMTHSNYSDSPKCPPRKGGGENKAKKGKMVKVKGGNNSGLKGAVSGSMHY